jgi:hypothetical protein
MLLRVDYDTPLEEQVRKIDPHCLYRINSVRFPPPRRGIVEVGIGMVPLAPGGLNLIHSWELIKKLEKVRPEVRPGDVYELMAYGRHLLAPSSDVPSEWDREPLSVGAPASVITRGFLGKSCQSFIGIVAGISIWSASSDIRYGSTVGT